MRTASKLGLWRHPLRSIDGHRHRRVAFGLAALSLALIGGLAITWPRPAPDSPGPKVEAGSNADNACLGKNATAATGGQAISPSNGACEGSTEPLGGLPRVPWEGGPDYWKKFTKTDAAGWDEPGFFPIGIYYNGAGDNVAAQYDKAHGINLHEGYSPGIDCRTFEDNDLYWAGDSFNETFTDACKAWVGREFMDETDGQYSIEEGHALLKATDATWGPDGRFRHANYTQIVTGDYGELNNSSSEWYVNAYAGSVSVDSYYYTIPAPGCQETYISVPFDIGHCRTASSYGKTVKALRARDAADGELKPVWNYVENLNGGPGEGPFFANISPGQLKGAVMNSVINEARGVMYFNTSHTGPCVTGGVLRSEQYKNSGCEVATPQMDAMAQVNNQIHRLAPIINTQSYQYGFGENLDTMLKWYDGAAYIFAMVSGDAASRPGARTFTLPPGLAKATAVSVVDEGRTIPVSAGTFSDDFSEEHSYHVYKVVG